MRIKRAAALLAKNPSLFKYYVKSLLAYVSYKVQMKVSSVAIPTVSLPNKTPRVPIIDVSSHINKVEEFWTKHTVLDNQKLRSAAQSRKCLERRNSLYPLFTELMKLYDGYDNKVILDYGCGPGHDLIGYLLYGNPQRVIGLDISLTALRIAQHRLWLHKIQPERATLIKTSDVSPLIPLAENHIDHIFCEGVLHHTSHPLDILREFRRVLKPFGTATIAVYNKNSLWVHLNIAYGQQVLEGKHKELSAYQLFEKEADSGAPIARLYSPKQFLDLCQEAGFDATFSGGFLSTSELAAWDAYWVKAINDERLDMEHRVFLYELTWDGKYPKYQGRYAGIGGVYWLRKSK